MPNTFKPLQTVEAWQLSNPPILSMAALLSSLEIFHEAGMIKLREKSEKLTSYLETLIKLELKEKIKIITPSICNNRGCQLSLRILQSKKNITNILYKNGIISDWREPDVIRVAPVPLYNTYLDCFNFVKILKSCLDEI